VFYVLTSLISVKYLSNKSGTLKTLVIFKRSPKIKAVERFTVYVVDFEGSLATGILEYGLVGIDSIEGIFSAEGAFCKNRGRISDAEFAQHHISEERVAGYEDFINVVPRFAELRAKSFFCAHNAAFENALLNSYCPVVLNTYGVCAGSQAFWGPWLDTCVLYKKYFKKVLQGTSRARGARKTTVDVGCTDANGGSDDESNTSQFSLSENASYAYRSKVLPSVSLQTLIDGCGLTDVLNNLGERFCPPDRRHWHAALYDALACALLFLNFIRSEAGRGKTLLQLLHESASEATAEALRQPTLFH
jgi:DNA polymerase-3 subunit epsilon